MKTSNRVQRNGATKPASSQVKIDTSLRRAIAADKREFKIPKGAQHHACFCVFDRENHEPVRKIPLGEQEFYDLWCSKINDKFSMEDFAAEAIREKIAGRSDQVFNSLTELEMAKNQSNALTQLMLDSEGYHLKNGDLNEADRDRMNAGVAYLVVQTNERLDAAFKSLFSALNPKREAVAS